MSNKHPYVWQCMFVVVCALYLCLMPAVAGAQNEATVRVTAILASHESTYIDSELVSIADEVKTLFTYSSFKKIKTYTVLLGEGQRDRVTLPREQDLVISYTNLDEKGNIALNVSLADMLDTDITLIDGGHILVGGPEYDDGTLILLIEAEL